MSASSWTATHRIGDNWRQQWDTLRLYTPGEVRRAARDAFPADAWYFPQKDEVADYLESYALEFDLPVRTNTRVDPLEPRTDGGYEVRIGDETITCDNVVVATGTFGQTPNMPGLRRRARPDDPADALERVPPPRRAPARPGAGGGRLPLGHGHRLRGAQTHPITLCGRDRGPDAVPARVSAGRASSSRSSSSRGGTSSPGGPRWGARMMPRGAVPRRARCSGSSARTSPAAAWSGTRPG